jgi:hypothetical protein
MATIHVTKRTDGKRWLQFAIIRDNAVTIMELTPAAWGGWNLHGVTQQGASDWPGSYTADAILAEKRRSPDTCDVEITAEEITKALDLEQRAPGILASRTTEVR